MNKTFSSFRRDGFSLIELLIVISIIVLLTAATVPAVSGLMKGGNFTNNINEVSDCLQQARATAMARNTYVWVGLLPEPANASTNKDKIDKVLLASVIGKNGQTSDLSTGNLTPLRKGRVLKNVTLQQFGAQILQNSGRQTVGVDDISTSNLFSGSPSAQFIQKVGSENIDGKQPTFIELIQFGPLGNARVKGTASNWIEIGMQSSPATKAIFGIVQINGLTGQVRIFRQ